MPRSRAAAHARQAWRHPNLPACQHAFYFCLGGPLWTAIVLSTRHRLSPSPPALCVQPPLALCLHQQPRRSHLVEGAGTRHMRAAAALAYQRTNGPTTERQEVQNACVERCAAPAHLVEDGDGVEHKRDGEAGHRERAGGEQHGLHTDGGSSSRGERSGTQKTHMQ